MNRIFKLLPELQGEELVTIQQVMKEMDDEEAEMFATVYRARRKDPQTVLILCLVSFLGIHGLQRLFGISWDGILYLFTGGICLIGTIVDAVNHKTLARDYNAKVITDVMTIVTSDKK